jgi:cation:H+ antiporter
VLTNALVNNVTNLTLLIGLPAIFWAMKAAPSDSGKPKKRLGGGDQQRVHKFSLLLTLTAALFFVGAVWLLGRDGNLNATDGWVLIGIFLFWQSFHVFEVLKSNARQNKSLGWMLPVNLALLGMGAYATYVSTDWLVAWLGNIHSGFVSAKHVGWLSGWLMVLPNAILAVYYGWRRKPEVVYSSQVGDGHICVPLCIGVFAVQHVIAVPAMFQLGTYILVGAIALHMFFVAVFGQLPRFIGILLVVAYGVFVYRGFGN